MISAVETMATSIQLPPEVQDDETDEETNFSSIFYPPGNYLPTTCMTQTYSQVAPSIHLPPYNNSVQLNTDPYK